MARRTRNQPTPEAAAGETETQTGDPAPKTRRPRQTQKTSTRRGRSAGQSSEAGQLIAALLKNRGSRGATQTDLEQVVTWAEGIRAEAASIEAEAADLRKLGPRGGTTVVAAPRRRQQREARQRELEERRHRSEMNRALLAGVLEGRISLDVQPQGGLLFLDGSQSAGEG